MNFYIMNIIPEEPEVYIETPRPTPGLSSLLTSKQFEYYTTANAAKLLGYLKPCQKGMSSGPATVKTLSKKLVKRGGIDKSSIFFLGIGFGILALTKVVKKLTK